MEQTQKKWQLTSLQLLIENVGKDPDKNAKQTEEAVHALRTTYGFQSKIAVAKDDGTLGKRDSPDADRYIWLPRELSVIPLQYKKAPSVLKIVPNSTFAFNASTHVAASMSSLSKEKSEAEEIKKLVETVTEAVQMGTLKFAEGSLASVLRPDTRNPAGIKDALMKHDDDGMSWAQKYVQEAKKCVDLSRMGLGPY